MKSDGCMSVKVSVIVAVYNVSGYLRQCLDSIEAQTFREMECVIVDDGSTDGSGAICDEYAERNPHFRVLHQPNGGLASARQAGLDMARGEYVIVCDGDDWVEPEMYGALYEAAAGSASDIAICGFWRDYRNGASVEVISGNGGRARRDRHGFMRHHLGCSWNKLVRRSLFVDNGLCYEPGIDMGEDLLMNYKIIRLDPLWIDIPVALYHYRKRIGESSYTNAIKPAYIEHRRRIYLWLRENFIGKEYSLYLLRDAINTVCMSAQSARPDKEFISGFEGEYIRWKDVLRHVADRRVFRFGILKPLATSHKIVLIRTYVRWHAASVEFRHRLREFLRRKRSGRVMRHHQKSIM